MLAELSFTATPEQAKDPDWIRLRIKSEIGHDEFVYKWKKRSIDARKPQVKIHCLIQVFGNDEELPKLAIFSPKDVSAGSEVAIVGSGPAGLFAALRALELGLKPVIFERGKDVRSRRRDLATLNREGLVNPESNYCFGEGGAGTYSDGKLYTRSKKRGDVQKALEWFVHFGAKEDILIDAHPHIGTNKLPAIIVAMREEIMRCGGEVHFGSKVTNIFSENGILTGLEINGNEIRPFRHAILATGHSARDVYEMLHRNGLSLLPKPFALGVRIEHPQDLIDKIQYHGRLHDDFLPPASYSLVTQVKNRGVYSFCMCPGGIVVPCATDECEVVTNGWSPSKRNNPFANSGIVVSLQPSDCGNPNDPFVCLNYQRKVEKDCWEAGGKDHKVPAQRLMDFLNGKVSSDLPKSSYQPGLESVDLNKVLPPLVAESLKEAFLEFGRKMKGFITNEAVLHAPESRTSSPIQIPRDEMMQHPQLKGLYPSAEGAGYAGGIISAGIDGLKCMEAIAEEISSADSSH